ncbi:MAG TPA: heparinase II/III family protein, partial [Polyangiaceae bacterium]|nr:heparinase II/III family protein [Polyangiaceae bacterium]
MDAAMDMIEGVYRLPRMSDSDPSLMTQPHAQALRDGSAVDCLGFAPDAVQHECEVPDWRAYLGSELSVYNQYILFGLRMTGQLLFTALHASDERLRERLEARTGRAASRSALARLRLDARNTALALFDSFVSEGHLPYALPQLPPCEAPGTGYPNPNRSWAPVLAQWDPGATIDALGRVVPAPAENTPVDCTGQSRWSYSQLRLSLWDPHATAYRAMVLADAYQMFRGILSYESRNAWLTAIRETGDALALPGGYEPGNNHGITESVALLQLAHDFTRTDRARLPSELTQAWLRLGRHRLNDLLVDTVFPDGVQVEQSPFYHDYQLNLLLDATSWLARAGIDLTADIDPRYAGDPDAVPAAQRLDFDAEHTALTSADLNRLNPSTALDVPGVIDGMVRAAIHVGLPSGWIPMIGSSLPQRFSGYAEPEFQGYVQQERPFSEQLRYYRSGGLEGEPPGDDERLTVFPDSGFVTLHSAFAPDFTRQTHLVFNAGVPFHRHSHPDALSVHLFGPDPGAPDSAGIPLLIDSGWFSYTADGRHYFESTSAHNTVNVDGASQCAKDALRKRANPYVDAPLVSCEQLAQAARQGGEPSLAPPGRVQLGLTSQGEHGGDSWLYASAVHGLYAGVAHRRGVLLLGREVLLVLDDLQSRSP